MFLGENQAEHQHPPFIQFFSEDVIIRRGVFIYFLAASEFREGERAVGTGSHPSGIQVQSKLSLTHNQARSKSLSLVSPGANVIKLFCPNFRNKLECLLD